MDLQTVMQQLKAWEHPKMRAVNAKHGAGDDQFGVNLSKLRALAGQLKRGAFEAADHCFQVWSWQADTTRSDWQPDRPSAFPRW